MEVELDNTYDMLMMMMMIMMMVMIIAALLVKRTTMVRYIVIVRFTVLVIVILLIRHIFYNTRIQNYSIVSAERIGSFSVLKDFWAEI